MTEDEAKAKWCPFARHANGSGGVGVNRVNWDREYPYANCIASACMAWRCTPEVCHVLVPDDVQGWRDAGWRIEQRGNDQCGVSGGVGYCGLAGRPD